MFWCLSIVPLLAQQAAKPDPKKALPPVNCRVPQNAEQRYQCFMEKADKLEKIAEPIKAKPPEALDFKIKQREAAALQAEEAQRLKAREEIQKIGESARKQNVSNVGRKYKVTFGRVSEPPPPK